MGLFGAKTWKDSRIVCRVTSFIFSVRMPTSSDSRKTFARSMSRAYLSPSSWEIGLSGTEKRTGVSGRILLSGTENPAPCTRTEGSSLGRAALGYNPPAIPPWILDERRAPVLS